MTYRRGYDGAVTRSARNEEAALELAHDLVALVHAAGADLDDAVRRPRPRLAHREHLRLGADRVAHEHGLRQADLLPPEVDAARLRRVGDRETEHERERERRVDERLS